MRVYLGGVLKYIVSNWDSPDLAGDLMGQILEIGVQIGSGRSDFRNYCCGSCEIAEILT